MPNGVQLVRASYTRLKPGRRLCLDMCRPVDMGLRYAEFAPIGHSLLMSFLLASAKHRYN
jgi:hypothetical protein